MVSQPQGRIPFAVRLMFTAIPLLLYFILSNIPLFGLSPASIDLFVRWRALFAGHRFSLTALGLQPIIYAAVISQILAGPKLLKLDLSNTRDQALYLNIQKLLVVVFSILMSMVYLHGFYEPDPWFATQLGVSLRILTIILFIQIFLGGVLIYYLEEVVSRWGIGSGISLFILADVSLRLITGLVRWVPDQNGLLAGVIPRRAALFPQASQTHGYDMTLLFQHNLIALLSTIAIFLILVYLLTTRVELKIPGKYAHRTTVRLPLLYFSYAFVVPLAFLNLSWLILSVIRSFGWFLWLRGITVPGTHDKWGNAVSGLMYYFSPIYGPWDWHLAPRIAITFPILVAGMMLSVFLWLKLTPGPESRDIKAMLRYVRLPRSRVVLKAMKRSTDRDVSKLVMVQVSVTMGLLYVLAGMFGTLGQVSVTELLFTVCVAYGFYEALRTTS